jgi:hypothetical protein
MANTLGSLVVRLGLDAAEFTSGLTKSEYQAKKFASSFSNQVAVGIVKAEIAMKALGEAASFALRAFPDLVKQAGDFQDLAEKTGASAEGLASLAVSAKVGGAEMDQLATFSIKLAKGLAGVDDESKAAGAALKSIGINIKEFKQLDPVGQFDALAKALAGYNEKGKAGVLENIAKGGAQLLPFLKELGEGVGRVNILSAEQIRLADEYSDKQARTRAELNLYAQSLATQMLPALTAFTGALTDVIKELLGVKNGGNDLKNSNAVKDFAEAGAVALAHLVDLGFGAAQVFLQIGKNVGGVAAALVALGSGDRKLAGGIIDQLRADNRAMVYTLGLADKVEARLRGQRTEGSGLTTGDFARADRKKDIKFNGADENGGAVLKKQLDGQIKAIKDFLDQQKSGYEFANTYLKGVYDDGLTSLSDFFNKSTALRQAGLAAEIAAFDAEIKALEAYRAKAGKPQERIDAENKIADARAKRAQVEQKSSQTTILATQAEAQAFKQLAYQYYDFLAAVRESRGDAAGAAALRIAKQTREAQELLTKVGFDPAEAQRQADAYGDRLTAQAGLNQAQADYNRLVETASIKEQEALLASRLAGQSEMETMKALSAIRQGALVDLGKIADEAARFAEKMGSPEAQQVAAKLALQFKLAAAEAEPLFLKMRDLGREAGESVASHFEDAILTGKSLRDTLKGIEQDLLRIIIRSQFTKPLGDFLGNMFGGNGTSSGGGGFFGNLFGLFGRGGASGGGGFGTGDQFGNLDLGGFLATGGPALPGKTYGVNERGPELLDVNGRSFLMMGNQRGRVTPLEQGSGGGTVIFNVTVPGGTPRETATQIAAMASQRLAMGRRNL